MSEVMVSEDVEASCVSEDVEACCCIYNLRFNRYCLAYSACDLLFAVLVSAILVTVTRNETI